MPVSRDEVVNAYRFILGREPESEEVVSKGMAHSEFASLRDAFLDSSEFRGSLATRGTPPPIGRFFDAQSHGTDIACTEAQMSQMLARISSAWQEFGRTEPHWSVLTSEKFKKDNIQDNIDDFYASGVKSVDRDFNFLRRSNRPLSFRKGLDFGCGVGRLTLALSPYCESVVGIDISPPHIKLANEQAELRSVANVEFRVLEQLDELSRLEPFDLILSKIVLQHNPPPIMAAILRHLLTALAEGGSAIIQMPSYKATQEFTVDEYLRSEPPKMEMNALPQQFIFEIIDQAGCRCLEIREDNETGALRGVSQTFAITKK
ncbi:class I SAM-dependent methyltransferase [Altererythrobacter sp. JGD-16]|uniref:Class I SAM-dependent methyltransferase n=1 Tax=Altererythrobacter lutimaris TaxID=2743979 RepID=A0A850H7Q6_9SPHN|nr:class I SAM-dependent methyltransferase [Altererythrobacter lutimaris]